MHYWKNYRQKTYLDRQSLSVGKGHELWHVRKVWILGTALGVIFLGIGAAQGQLGVIWKKAVMICMECIGIG